MGDVRRDVMRHTRRDVMRDVRRDGRDERAKKIKSRAFKGT